MSLDQSLERDLEALMRQRKLVDSRLNRALNELLGSGTGISPTLKAIEEMEEILRAIATFVGELPA
ncbi:MAG: hypothetical protein ACYDGR_17960 [Candidatus Dormibacteria bacterium]